MSVPSTESVYLPGWLGQHKRTLQQAAHRHESVRLGLLLIANSPCGLAIIAPILITIAAFAGAIQTYEHRAGPLDLFIIEALTATGLVASFISLQLLRIRPSVPAGIRIKNSDAGELYGILERRVAHFKTPPVNGVVVSTDSKICIVSTPRWLLPVAQYNELRVGFPLMYFLSPAQFRLALASVMYSFAYKQHHWRGWLAQAISDWPKILDALKEKNNLASRLLQKPVSLTMRVNERLGQELIDDCRQKEILWLQKNSDDGSANDFLAIQIVTEMFLEKQYWPMIFKATERCPAPVVKPFSHFEWLLEKLLRVEDTKRWLLQTQVSKNREIRDTLAALSIDHIHWPGLPSVSSMATLIHSSQLSRQLDALWREQIQLKWDDMHHKFQIEKKRFEQLNQRAQRQTLRGKSALHYVELAESFVKNENLREVYLSVYQGNQDDASVCFACGKKLLATPAAKCGIAALERATELDRGYSHRARALINQHKQAEFDPHGYSATA